MSDRFRPGADIGALKKPRREAGALSCETLGRSCSYAVVLNRSSGLTCNLGRDATIHTRSVPDGTIGARAPTVGKATRNAAGNPVGIDRLECQIADHWHG